MLTHFCSIYTKQYRTQLKLYLASSLTSINYGYSMRNVYENKHYSTHNVYTKTFHVLINMFMVTTRNVEFTCLRQSASISEPH